jgi:phenylpropionate dioxygenase-like ring-hydroxylating dioxygenase large terminal subunit
LEKLKNHWYLICPLKDIGKQMIAKTILGENLIIFKDETGKIVALEDRCCHRNVQLSLGYLQNGKAVCGYHGWEYNGAGHCVKIPSQLPETKIPPTAKIKSYPVSLVNNWVWLFMGNLDREERVPPPDITEMGQWPYTYKSHIFKGDLESVAESLIDPYHVAFTHRNSIGSFMGQIEEFPADFNLTVVEDGLEGSYSRANRGSLAEKIYFGRNKKITAKIRFYYPNISRLQVDFRERTLLILEHVMAVDEQHVEMMQITLWKNIFARFPAFARLFMSRKSDKIVNEDIVLLESQLEIIRSRNGDYRDISVKGDEVSLAFKKFWRRKLQEEAVK